MTEVEALERQLVKAKEAIERRDMVQKLCKNREFKKLVLDYYMVEECARYVHNSANPAMKHDERNDSLAMAQAAGHLKRFLIVVEQIGDQAESQIPHIENAIAETRAEEI